MELYEFGGLVVVLLALLWFDLHFFARGREATFAESVRWSLGWLVLGLAGTGAVIALNDSGVAATLFYLFAYGFSTLGAFAVVSVVRNARGEEETDMSRWAGLGRSHPLVGVVFSLFLLAFAGIPLTSGFVSKFAVFKAAAEGGASPLVIVGVCASAVAAYFYVRVIVLLFFTDPPADGPTVVVPSALSTATVTVSAAITLALGALPQPILDLANTANQFIP